MEGFYTVARDGFSLSAQLIPMGCDLCVIVTGGKAHIGSVSLAQPTERARTLCRPNHREDEVSALFAETLSSHFGVNTAVLCGIHYDNATPQDIQKLLELSRELLENTQRHPATASQTEQGSRPSLRFSQKQKIGSMKGE